MVVQAALSRPALELASTKCLKHLHSWKVAELERESADGAWTKSREFLALNLPDMPKPADEAVGKACV
jgi:hypothetical protein